MQRIAAVLEHSTFMDTVSTAIAVLGDTSASSRLRLDAVGLMQNLAYFGTTADESDLGFGVWSGRTPPAAAAVAADNRRRLHASGAFEAALAAVASDMDIGVVTLPSCYPISGYKWPTTSARDIAHRARDIAHPMSWDH
jgi:hypothetical protein